jgi:hypothetical protein
MFGETAGAGIALRFVYRIELMETARNKAPEQGLEGRIVERLW